MVLVVTALLIVALVAVVVWWINTSGYETTDDAFIDARTVSISSQVNAAIVDVPVTDNQLVEAGAVLVRLDDRDYKAQLDQASAGRSGTANIANIDAQIAAQQARIEQADKQAAQSQADSHLRATAGTALHRSGQATARSPSSRRSNTRPVCCKPQATFRRCASQRGRHAKSSFRCCRRSAQAEAQLEQARAAQEQAEANLSRTLITAPVAGRVTRLTAAKGNYAAVGQALMMFVPRDVWVTANFKETQLADGAARRSGRDQRSTPIRDRTFKGHVDSIQAGSGTAFSLLPAENATGNYVKIVQRVPVKIVFDEPPDVLLGPGMSVVPTVKAR